MAEVPRLYFLGVPGIQVVGAASPKPLAGLRSALLSYVFLTPRPVSRSHLAQLFWPGADRARGLQSLRQMLSVIRGQFAHDPLAHQSGAVSWQHGLIDVDVAQWQGAVAARSMDAVMIV